MNTLEREQVYFSFLGRLSGAPSRVLLIDYDGTLAPFSVDREHAFPYPEIPGLLGRIMAAGTRVVLISGRPAREVLLLAGVHPHSEIWGSHGRERLTADGDYNVQDLPAEYETALLHAAEAIRHEKLESRMELKTGGVAIHWRGLDGREIADLERRVLELWKPMLSGDSALELLKFDGGLELRVPGTNKGRAVETILKETGAEAAIAYLGDDLTDEDAFRALKGRGLTVLVRPQFRSTTADVWLQPPQELIQFFEEWLRTAGGNHDQ